MTHHWRLRRWLCTIIAALSIGLLIALVSAGLAACGYSGSNEGSTSSTQHQPLHKYGSAALYRVSHALRYQWMIMVHSKRKTASGRRFNTAALPLSCSSRRVSIQRSYAPSPFTTIKALARSQTRGNCAWCQISPQQPGPIPVLAWYSSSIACASSPAGRMAMSLCQGPKLLGICCKLVAIPSICILHNTSLCG